MTLSIALLGAGRIGTVHADALSRLAGVAITAVADADAEAARRLAARHGAAVRDAATIATDGAIDAVLICTPTDTHADLIERFARAGKAIFCEKPIDLDPARARACLEVVAACGVPLMIGFNRRFDPRFAALRRAIEEGRIGRVESVLIISRDPAPPPLDYIRRSGGLFKDMTIHDFDMARFLLGEEIAAVRAEAAALVDPAIGAAGDHDTATVILTTASGRQAVIVNSRRSGYGYDQRIEVHGSRGLVAAPNPVPAEIVTADAAGLHRPPLHDFFMTRYRDAYRAEMAAFVAALREGRPPRPDGRDGLAALAIAEAASRALASGRAEPVA